MYCLYQFVSQFNLDGFLADFILGGNTSTGVATLRRDGFTSVEAMMDGSPGLLTTRPLIFDQAQVYLFVNTLVQPGGFLQVAVLDVETQLPLPDFPLNGRFVPSQLASYQVLKQLWFAPVAGSSIAGLEANTAIPVLDTPNSPPFDSTRATVTWPATAATLSSVAGRPVRLQFRMNSASLFSFWVAIDACGGSNGYVGNGGPGLIERRDVKGKCGGQL